MEALFNLPDRGCFGVVEGFRRVQDGPPYICCLDTSPTADRIITNGRQQLHDLYRKSQQRYSAAVVAKRQAYQQLDERNSKRQQTRVSPGGSDGGSGLDAALDALAGAKNSTMPVPAVAAAAATATHAAATVLQSGGVASGVVAGRSRDSFAVPAVPTLLAAAAAGRHQQGGSNISSSRQIIYTAEELKSKTNKELVELLRARNCPVSGSKTDLIRRLLDYQRRVKKAQS